MKVLKRLSILCVSVVLLSGCANFHTGKVVVDENEDKKSSKNAVIQDIKYILVEEKDKDSLIKNIKEGKGAVITRSRYDEKKRKNNDNEDNNQEESENSNSSGNNGNR